MLSRPARSTASRRLAIHHWCNSTFTLAPTSSKRIYRVVDSSMRGILDSLLSRSKKWSRDPKSCVVAQRLGARDLQEDSFLHTGFVSVRSSAMHHAERCSTVGPHQHQSVLPLRHSGQRALHVGRTLHRLAIDLHDHVTAL